MKKKLFIIAAAAMLLGMTACQKEQITPNKRNRSPRTIPVTMLPTLW